MPRIINNININITSETPFGPAAIPDGVSRITMRFDRTARGPTNWHDPATSLTMVAEVSPDGGSTWIDGYGFSAQGGVFHDPRTGLEVEEFRYAADLPAGTGRLVRGTLIPTGGRIRTKLNVDVE